MSNLTNIQERIDIMQCELNTLKSLAEQLNQEEKPLFELSPEIIQLIKDTFNYFVEDKIIGQLDTSHTASASGDGFDIDITFDLQECVSDALPSIYRLANDFIDDVISELTSKQEAYDYEQSQITIARIVEHEDQQESENN